MAHHLWYARDGLHYHGISGTPSDSYSDVAGRVDGRGISGITGEIAFVAVERFNARVGRLRPALPVTRATLAVLRALGSNPSIEQWWKALPQAIRPAKAADLTALGALAAWGWVQRFVMPTFAAAEQDVERTWSQRWAA